MTTIYNPGPECFHCGGHGGLMRREDTGTIYEHVRPKDCIQALRWKLENLMDDVRRLEYERTLR